LQRTPNKDSALDAAKAIAISLVLIWHLQPFVVASGYTGRIAYLLQVILALFYQQISLIAVPLFILVSLYLLCGKLDCTGTAYAARRLRRLMYLYTAWTICQFACFCLLQSYQDFMIDSGITWPHISEPAYMLLMNGGPTLPRVGGSVFYYLFILICLSGLMVIFQTIPLSTRSRYFLACFSTVLCLCYFQWLSWDGRNVPYWRLDNFLVYVPIAHLVRHHERSWHAGTVAVLLGCFFIFAIQDEFIRNHLGNTGAYSRPSVVFGSVALFALLRVFLPESRKMPRAVTFLATYSLGLFAIHKYWRLVICLVGDNFDLLSAALVLDINAFFKAIGCITLTCGTVYIVGRTRWRSLVL